MRTPLTPTFAATAGAAVAALLGLLLLPAAGLALEADDDVTIPAEAATDCEPLVAFRTTGTSGDARAVAITAQALEQGVAGWSMVAWEVAEGAVVTSLTIVTTDGATEIRTEGIGRGSAHDVRELRFCGPAAAAESDGEPTAADEQAEADDGEAGAGEDRTPPNDPAPAPDGTEPQVPADEDGADDVASDGGDGDDAVTSAPDHGTSETPEGDGQETLTRGDGRDRPSPEAAPEDDGRADEAEAGDTVVAAGDAEVLGVQLARTGGDVVGLLIWGTLGTVAGAVVLLTARRRDHEGRRS